MLCSVELTSSKVKWKSEAMQLTCLDLAAVKMEVCFSGSGMIRANDVLCCLDDFL